MTTIDIYLQPMVWSYLRRIGEWDGRAITLPNSHRHIYNLITANLEHHQVISAAAISRHCSKMDCGKIYITDYDASRYGTNIRIDRQANISRFIYNLERERLCQLIAAAHIFSGCSIASAISFFLDKYYLDCDDLSFDNLKKYYTRHYKEIEHTLLRDLQQIKSSQKTHRNT